VDNTAGQYQAAPVTVVDGFFKNRTLSFNEYSLVHRRDTGETDRDRGRDRGRGAGVNRQSAEYYFYNKGELLYRVELMEETLTIFGLDMIQSYLRYQQPGGPTIEYRLDTMRSSGRSELTFNDELIGTLVVSSYRSRNGNALDKDHEYNTGLRVDLNGEEYAILTYYRNPQLYLRINHPALINSSPEVQTRVMLYILALYEFRVKFG
jgi:hypothetical protein